MFNKISNKKTIFILLAISGLLFAAGMLWKYGPAARPANPPTTSRLILQDHDERIGTASKGSEFELVLDEEKLVRGPDKIVVERGASVHINIIAGGHEEAGAYLEGYGITTEADPEAPGAFSFIADTPGTFAYYALEEPPAGIGSDEIPAKYRLGTLVVR
ncbi:MAG TPA: hypothetical protein VF598_09020 [Hymenobacter sp.]|jgi:hypothetical protein